MNLVHLHLLAALALAGPLAGQSRIAGFQASPWFEEQVLVLRPADGVRAAIVAASDFDAARPTRAVLYATPNGSTLEHTLGARTSPGIDWKYGIQNVAAQTRCLRALAPDENLVLVCVEAETLSWPSWRAARGGGEAGVRKIVERILEQIPGTEERVTLCAHSGGGSFLWGYLEHGTPIPADVDRIVFLDANYSFAEEKGHGAALLDWLESPEHRLVVVAYDDREITYQGRRVVGPTGGTFRATQRMFDAFEHDIALTTATSGPFEVTRALDGRFTTFRHRNEKNLILHTALVGDMNGLLHALTLGTSNEKRWGTFGGPRAYDDWIQAEPGTGWDDDLPVPFRPRPTDARGGRAIFAELNHLALAEREERVLAEIERGNLPDLLRRSFSVELSARTSDGERHVLIIDVLPDYLSVGSDEDFVRTPLTPRSAQRVADRHGFMLPTPKMVDAIHAAAAVRLRPHPLTEAREHAATFVVHDDAIAQKLEGEQRGRPISGIKKDVVITAGLAGKVNHVAIYGWHRVDGVPIQPLYLGHIEGYVDYSHGVRLVGRTALLNGRQVDIADVLADPELHVLLSGAGPIARGLQAYPR